MDVHEVKVFPICYLAGPMTGISGFNYPAFDAARDKLEWEGWIVLSPADMDREMFGESFENMTGHEDVSKYASTFARNDIGALLKAHAMFVLPGWEESTGVRNELDVAAMLGVPIFDFETRDPIGWKKQFSGIESISPRRQMLEEAANLVDGDRNAQYGDPRQDFRRTAQLWSTYLDGKTTLDMHDVAAMMALLKLSRIRWSPSRQDSWVDLAGYAACGWDCARPEASG